MVFVSDSSLRGRETVRRLHGLAREMEVQYDRLGIVVNRIRRAEHPRWVAELRDEIGAQFAVHDAERPDQAVDQLIGCTRNVGLPGQVDQVGGAFRHGVTSARRRTAASARSRAAPSPVSGLGLRFHSTGVGDTAASASGFTGDRYRRAALGLGALFRRFPHRIFAIQETDDLLAR